MFQSTMYLYLIKGKRSFCVSNFNIFRITEDIKTKLLLSGLSRSKLMIWLVNVWLKLFKYGIYANIFAEKM